MKPLRCLGRTRNERGAVAVEFALIVPVLLVLVFGGIEYGRIYSELEVIESAAREGARAAATRGTAGDIEAAVTAAASPYTVDGTPTADKVCSPDTVGQSVSVSWVQNFKVNIAFIPAMDVDRTITGTFRCE